MAWKQCGFVQPLGPLAIETSYANQFLDRYFTYVLHGDYGDSCHSYDKLQEAKGMTVNQWSNGEV